MAAALDRQTWDLVIADHSMPHFTGSEALALVRERGLDVPFICVSGTITEELAVAAMKAGASDWVTKGQLKRLLPAIERELREAKYYETFVRDVTEQRSLQRQLAQAQKMEAVGRLAGGIAHDFNNLLTVITSYSELLLQDLTADDPKREDVEQVRKAAEGAAGLTRQLLAFSRQQVLEPKVGDLNAVVRGGEKLLQRGVGDDVDRVTVL